MNVSVRLGLASLIAVSTCSSTGWSADLYGRGSMKDTYAPMPMQVASGAGPCYVRADVGYSISQDPKIKWPVTTAVVDDANSSGDIDAGEVSYHALGDYVSEVSIDNTWLGDIGIGCGSGSRGWRGELALGYRGKRDVHGRPLDWIPGPSVGDTWPPSDDTHIDDPLHTSLTTYLAMANVYHDLGNFGGFNPYIGAGVGLAYHIVDDVYFTGNPFLTNQIHGDKDVSFAWSVMAGVGYQISERAILDVGYRYIDMGKATSERHDTAGYVNPRVVIDDITAHELKVGLRYHFGSSSQCCAAPLK